MLLRLILALLIMLPVPAMAACHPAPQPAAMAGHDHHMPAQPQPTKQAPAEPLCIGCIAPATIRAPQLTAPLAHGLTLTAPTRARGSPLSAPAPDTPPPRSEA